MGSKVFGQCLNTRTTFPLPCENYSKRRVFFFQTDVNVYILLTYMQLDLYVSATLNTRKGLLHKVNRCLARYSPREHPTTCNGPTFAALEFRDL